MNMKLMSSGMEDGVLPLMLYQSLLSWQHSSKLPTGL